MPAVVIKLERVCVRRERVEANVRVVAGFRETTPDIARRILSAFPNLARHTCVNDAGPVFGAVINRTPLPHLLEHLVIELQVAGEKCDTLSECFTYVGTTQWLDEGAGLARVEVNYVDDLAALRAFRDALRAINEAVVG